VIDQLQSVFGLAVLLGMCYLLSSNRALVSPTFVAKSLVLQVAVALLLLKVPASHTLFEYLNQGVEALMRSSREGSSFVFGYLGGSPVPFEETIVGGSFVLAFQVFPLIILISVLSGLLMHFRILPLLVDSISWVLRRTLGIGGATGLAVASIAGTMLVVEAAIIGDAVPNAVGHLLSASLITLPGVIYISHLLVPNVGAVTATTNQAKENDESIMEVISSNTSVGLQIFLNVIAMLMVMVALVHLLNQMLGLVPDIWGAPISIERLLGYALAPIAWLIGIPWSEAVQAGQLMGVKTVLTELVAYIQFSELAPDVLSERSKLIMTYALCGFANFVSLGIMVSGLITITPERRQEILGFSFKALGAGIISTCTTATIVGFFF